MHIVKDKKFEKNLKSILRFIASDGKSKAKRFNHLLFEKISKLSYMPYKYRKSFYYDSKDIRDLIYKGYTIPYFIDKDNNKIVLLDIFKWSYR